MVVPTFPFADFILGHAQLALAVLESPSDRVPLRLQVIHPYPPSATRLGYTWVSFADGEGNRFPQ